MSTAGTSVVAAVWIPLVILAVDPDGWYPFGPAKWLVVASGVLVLATGTFAMRRIVVEPRAQAAMVALVALFALAAMRGLDPTYAWVGTPERHFGVVTWLLLVFAFFAGLNFAAPQRVLWGTAIAGLAVGATATAEAVGWEPRVFAVDDRLSATLGSPAYLGAVTAVLLPIAIATACDRALTREVRLVAAASVPLLGVAVLGSGARAAWLGLVAAVVLLGARRGRAVASRASVPTVVVIVAVASAAAVAIAVWSPVGSRITSTFDDDEPGGRGRLDEWRVAVHVAGDHLGLGVGPEGYRIAFAEGVDAAYERAHGRDPTPDRAHAGPLDVLLTGGVGALALWVSCVALVGRYVWRALVDDRRWVPGIGAALIAHFVGQLVLFMHDDLRFDRYFSVRARGIELPPANIAAVIDRAARRHRHRRAAVSACTAVAVLAAAVSVSSLDGRPATQQVVARPAGGILVESPLAWNVVAPQSGLSWSHSTVIGPNDAVYSLSTAPGAVAVDGASLPATLYRSTDGTEWTPVELPANLHASSLASTSRALYAIGTAPAGGNLRSVQLASTNATNGTWSKTTLPLDVGVLEARYGVKIGLGRLSVASDGSRVVAAVRLQVMEGIDRLLPPGTDAESGYRITEAGIDVLAKPTLPDRAGLEAMGPDAKAARPARPEMNVTASYTWAQLGIDDSLRSLILGEARVFSSADGQRFDEVQLPEMVRWVGGLFATPDGFRIFGSVEFPLSEIASWRSTDGHTWVTDANGASAGHLLASGQRQGRVALVTAVEQADRQDVVVKMEQPDGTWSDFGVTDLVHRAGIEGEFYPSGTAAVGPLGVAVLVTSQRGEEPPRSYLVTTADGIEASVIELAPLVADGYPADVRVTADAITVSFTSATIDGPLRLVVGTPRR